MEYIIIGFLVMLYIQGQIDTSIVAKNQSFILEKIDELKKEVSKLKH